MITLGDISDVLGILSFFVSIIIWLKLKIKERFDECRIKIVLVADDSTTVYLPCEIERKHLTRSEIQGLIGVLPTHEQKRYKLESLRTKEFFDELAIVQDNMKQNVLKIKCSKQEIEQFIF